MPDLGKGLGQVFKGLQKISYHGTVTRYKRSNRSLLEWLGLVSVSFPVPSSTLCVLQQQEWRLLMSHLCCSVILSFAGCSHTQGNGKWKMEPSPQQLLEQNHSPRNGTKEGMAPKLCELEDSFHWGL